MKKVDRATRRRRQQWRDSKRRTRAREREYKEAMRRKQLAPPIVILDGINLTYQTREVTVESERDATLGGLFGGERTEPGLRSETVRLELCTDGSDLYDRAWKRVRSGEPVVLRVSRLGHLVADGTFRLVELTRSRAGGLCSISLVLKKVGG